MYENEPICITVDSSPEQQITSFREFYAHESVFMIKIPAKINPPRTPELVV